MAQYELNFYDYWRIIRRRKWIILLSFVLVLVASILFTNMQIPKYEAHAIIKIEQRRTMTGIMLTDWFTYSPGDVMATEVEVIKGRLIAEEATRRLGWIDEKSTPVEIDRAALRIQNMVATERLLFSNLIQITVISNNPREAAQVANTVAQVYRDKDTEKRNRQAEEMRKFIEKQLRMTEIKLADAEQALEVKINEEAYIMLNKKYKEALITEAEKIELVSIVNPAIEPTSPMGPGRRLNMIVGGIVGLLLGFAFAFIRENLDTSIGRIEEVESYLKTPVLGIIPHITAGEEKRRFLGSRALHGAEKVSLLRKQLVAHFHPKSSVAEAYRSLQTNTEFARLTKKGNTLLFTSTGPQEGKTITAANYAVALAQTNKRVLLIEADLRRPLIHKIFGLKKEPGLTEVLLGSLSWEEAVRKMTDIIMGEMGLEEILKTPGMENLTVLTSGALPPNPVEVLNSPEMTNLIEELKTRFDILVFDCPPVLPVADALILGSKAEGTILVYRAGRTGRGALRRTKTLLEGAKANLLGLVLNDIKATEIEPGSPYYYYYHKYYGAEEEAKRRGIFSILKRKFFSIPKGKRH